MKKINKNTLQTKHHQGFKPKTKKIFLLKMLKQSVILFEVGNLNKL